MTPGTMQVDESSVDQAVEQLREAASAKKCWPCGCLHGAISSIDRMDALPRQLDAGIRRARDKLEPVRYDCLGCEVCFPANALNVLGIDGVTCPTEPVEERRGWPPLPGSYRVLRYRAPVAVCTLTDGSLATAIARAAGPEVAVVGTLHTENLGIERVVRNVLANPNVRFLIVCGAESRQAVGHLPGQSLVALARSGIDDHMRIVGAKGKRPVLRNLTAEACGRFRSSVEVVDLIANDRVANVLEAVRHCAERNPGVAERSECVSVPSTIGGYSPSRMVPDAAGYLLVYVDRARRRLTLEHYCNDGLLDAVIEGKTAVEVWTPVIERGFITRLDHAAYLGRELTRAEAALVTGEPYVQDAAPDRQLSDEKRDSGCGCGPSCGDRR